MDIFSIVILQYYKVPGGLNLWTRRNPGYRGLSISHVQINPWCCTGVNSIFMFPYLVLAETFGGQVFILLCSVCLLEFAQQIFLDVWAVHSPYLS